MFLVLYWALVAGNGVVRGILDRSLTNPQNGKIIDPKAWMLTFAAVALFASVA